MATRKKTFWLLLLLVVASGGAGALDISENLRGKAAGGFESLSVVRAALSVRPWIRQGYQPQKANPRNAARYIHLSGRVTMSGSGHVPTPSGYATVMLTGYTQLSDQNGRVLNGSVSFSDTRSYFVSGRYVTGTSYPSATVSIYENGGHLGDIRVQGSIPVSGFVNGNWLSLSGSGTVSGDGYIQGP